MVILGTCPPFAIVLVPKATVDEDDLAARSKDKVWPAREVGDVQSVAVAEAMRQPSNQEFGLGIAAAHSGHNATANFRPHVIHDGRSLRQVSRD
jgi:hypothetical protein